MLGHLSGSFWGAREVRSAVLARFWIDVCAVWEGIPSNLDLHRKHVSGDLGPARVFGEGHLGRISNASRDAMAPQEYTLAPIGLALAMFVCCAERGREREREREKERTKK